MRHSPQFVMERDPTAFYCIVRQQCAYSSAHRLTPLFTTASDSAETPRRPAEAGAPPWEEGGGIYPDPGPRGAVLERRSSSSVERCVASAGPNSKNRTPIPAGKKFPPSSGLVHMIRLHSEKESRIPGAATRTINSSPGQTRSVVPMNIPVWLRLKQVPLPCFSRLS